MPSAAVISALMYASILILLSLGFTFTQMIEKFPNFAHTSYATVGVIISYTFARLWGYNPYLAWPFAFVLSGLFGIALVEVRLRQLSQHESLELGKKRASTAVFDCRSKSTAPHTRLQHHRIVEAVLRAGDRSRWLEPLLDE